MVFFLKMFSLTAAFFVSIVGVYLGSNGYYMSSVFMGVSGILLLVAYCIFDLASRKGRK